MIRESKIQAEDRLKQKAEANTVSDSSQGRERLLKKANSAKM